MGKTNIGWVARLAADGSLLRGETWNPLAGCTRVTAGCDHCYAFALHDRRHAYSLAHGGRYPDGRAMAAQYAQPFSEVQVIPARLDEPLHKRQPTTYFVNSMSDFFHSAVSLPSILDMLNVMRRADWHTFLILTKRAGRLRRIGADLPWPENVGVGVSIETDDLTPRADALRNLPVAMRFLSLEPLLGPLPSLNLDGIDWVITGGESGPGFRPCDPAWVRALRDAAAARGIAYFHKQWGGRLPTSGGRLLDGETWDELPLFHPERVAVS